MVISSRTPVANSKAPGCVRGNDRARKSYPPVDLADFYGAAGPSAAGTTTTTEVLLRPRPTTAGSARVLGLDVVKDAREVGKPIGYVCDSDRGVYRRLSGYDNLRYFAGL